ncbi:hypothetical protein [Sphingomonas colocasiae]|uniref:Uncharacterized protein n=1 Tax=Sphingomonas colocasiae TaxID=1848973 RepID=A0ABS7PKQ6_9SPHN|nr:hypothetical protein [Sphingomonas colocasiae]MBY8821072.1 hypothetical protein [Sphingomonas colocasiae]
MHIEAQIEELRAELAACVCKRERRQIERELAAAIVEKDALAEVYHM